MNGLVTDVYLRMDAHIKQSTTINGLRNQLGVLRRVIILNKISESVIITSETFIPIAFYKSLRIAWAESNPSANARASPAVVLRTIRSDFLELKDKKSHLSDLFAMNIIYLIWLRACSEL